MRIRIKIWIRNQESIVQSVLLPYTPNRTNNSYLHKDKGKGMNKDKDKDNEDQKEEKGEDEKEKEKGKENEDEQKDAKEEEKKEKRKKENEEVEKQEIKENKEATSCCEQLYILVMIAGFSMAQSVTEGNHVTLQAAFVNSEVHQNGFHSPNSHFTTLPQAN